MGIFSKITMISSGCWTYTHFLEKYKDLKEKLDKLKIADQDWTTLITNFERYETMFAEQKESEDENIASEAFYTQLRLKSLRTEVEAIQYQIGELKSDLREIQPEVKDKLYPAYQQLLQNLLSEEKKAEKAYEDFIAFMDSLAKDIKELKEQATNFVISGQTEKMHQATRGYTELYDKFLLEKPKYEPLVCNLNKIRERISYHRELEQNVEAALFMREHPNETANYMIDQDRFDQYKGMATFKKGPGHWEVELASRQFFWLVDRWYSWK